MKKELPHFTIGSSYGGSQSWFREFSMRLGGCAAATACDICVYLDLYKGTTLCPYDVQHLTKHDYVRFATGMKPYLHPRMGGIDDLSVFTVGFSQYVKNQNGALSFSAVDGTTDVDTAKRAVIAQIDSGLPVAFLCLKHKNRHFRDYRWHWFLLNGYERSGVSLRVKAVTYGAAEWLSFDDLWQSGYAKRGGMVLPAPTAELRSR